VFRRHRLVVGRTHRISNCRVVSHRAVNYDYHGASDLDDHGAANDSPANDSAANDSASSGRHHDSARGDGGDPRGLRGDT
jgi:hypothetical protein